jgi:GlcNAc-P-P-Und epimerase
MKTSIIFGGSGYIGSNLCDFFIENNVFDIIYIVDITPPSKISTKLQLNYIEGDVRSPIINSELLNVKADWIFNFAAVHREPGHNAEEYFETNLLGATNVTDFANRIHCNKIYFTSSIAVYGPSYQPINENKLPNPITPYGSSKYPAELIHQKWLAENENRRLIIVRPGVVYGPGDPGNILRMIRAIIKGYFFFPGSRNIYKSYGYIFGLIDSIKFTMRKKDKLIIYNYVEQSTLTIGELATVIKKYFGITRRIYSLPGKLLFPLAKILQYVLGNKNPIHPRRVKKAGMPTHIIPQYLIDQNFPFRYDFEKSLVDWKKRLPEDFI